MICPWRLIRGKRALPRACRGIGAALALIGGVMAVPAGAAAPPIAFGTAWYPEQWPEARWEPDLQLMTAAHINTVRIAEFAWSSLEPEEGRFEFGWLDRAIAAAAAHGIRVVLGTPTAAPPVWLTERYPDVLRVDEDGQRAGHGGRRQFSFASARYRAFARDIANRLAARYGRNANVIGWQIDNEIGPPSFDPAAVALWHRFLAERYGTVAELNGRWATAYWSQAYQRFDQVPLHGTGQQNPGLLLDFRHFCTETWTSYVQNQVQAIRAHADPRQFVTTNSMHWNAGYDHFRLHAGLDLAAWDDYIETPEPDWAANGANHDLVRGYKDRNFWVMETQAGRIDWVAVNRALRPGQVREMGWQAVQHGADAVLYWEFRPAPNGQETNYGTLLAPDGTPAPIYREIAKLGGEFARASAALAGTQLVADVAFLWSYDSRWAIDIQPMHKDFDPVAEWVDIYRPFRAAAGGVAVRPPDADLSRYKLVVAPSLNVLTGPQAANLAAYVRNGGTLLLGPRTGQKDGYDALWDARQPGPLRDLLGAHVEQFYALDKPVPVAGALGAGTTSIWADALVPDRPDARPLLSYRDPGGWLDGRAAVVMTQVGKGRVGYLGAWLDPARMAALAATLLKEAGVRPPLPGADPALEVGERDGEGRRVVIAINHDDRPHAMTVPPGATLVAGSVTGGTIAPHDLAVLEIAR